MDNILSKLIDVLIPILATLLTALIGLLIAYIQKKINQINEESLRNLISHTLEEAERVATEAVLATQQILVDDLKKKAQDGKLTREEAEQAMNTAKQYFFDHITNESLAVLESIFENLDSWVRELIEAQLAKLKTKSS